MKSTESHSKQTTTNSASSKTSEAGISLPSIPVLQQKETSSEETVQEFSAQQKTTTQFASGADDTKPVKPFQLKPNNTGLPDNLKSGVENLSGMDLSDVKVHYNSSQPAQLNALAYAQGNNIHVGPGQEKHLPHEAWHVVQQAQGRVQATTQLKSGVAVNDDPALEHEADVMGEKAMNVQLMSTQKSKSNSFGEGGILQPKIGFEFQTTFNKTKFLVNGTVDTKKNEGKMPYYKGNGFSIEGDEGDLELVTKPFEENESGFQEMASVFSWMEVFAGSVAGKRFRISQLNRHFASADPVGNVLSKDDIDLNVDGKIETDPQVTAGISLGSLIPLASMLASGPKRKRVVGEETVPVLGSDATHENLVAHIGWKDVDANFFMKPILMASELALKLGGGRNDNMKGFLFMLSLYSLGYSALWASRETRLSNAIEKGDEKTAGEIRSQGMQPFWAKLSVGLISRTNLADAFMTLAEEDKIWFRAKIDAIANTIGQNAFDTKHSNEPILHEGDGVGDYRVFGPMANNKDAENYKSWFTIRDWLSNLAPKTGELGVDFSAAYEGMGDISSRAFHHHGVNDPAFRDPRGFEDDKDESRARYNLSDSPTNIGKAANGGEDRLGGLIIEFRKLGAKIDESQWWAFASNVFKLVVLTNQNETRRNQIVDSFIRS